MVVINPAISCDMILKSNIVFTVLVIMCQAEKTWDGTLRLSLYTRRDVLPSGYDMAKKYMSHHHHREITIYYGIYVEAE